MRLIDADALKEEIESLRIYVSGIKSGRKITDELLTEYRKSVIDRIDEQETVNQWIPCSKRMPPDLRFYYTTNKFGMVTALYWNRFNEEWQNDIFKFDKDHVIAWLPIPEAYNEAEE